MGSWLVTVTYRIDATDETDAEVQANALGLIGNAPYGSVFVRFDVTEES